MNYYIGDKVECVKEYDIFKRGDVYELKDRVYSDGFKIGIKHYYINDLFLHTHWKLVSRKFKVGNTITDGENIYDIIIVDKNNKCYMIRWQRGIVVFPLSFKNQHKWYLVEEKEKKLEKPNNDIIDSVRYLFENNTIYFGISELKNELDKKNKEKENKMKYLIGDKVKDKDGNIGIVARIEPYSEERMFVVFEKGGIGYYHYCNELFTLLSRPIYPKYKIGDKAVEIDENEVVTIDKIIIGYDCDRDYYIEDELKPYKEPTNFKEFLEKLNERIEENNDDFETILGEFNFSLKESKKILKELDELKDLMIKKMI